jgi:hypothetical protein
VDGSGTVAFWASSDFLARYRCRVTIANNDDRYLDSGHPVFDVHADFAFDLVHSNSAIEHVGGWSDMLAMAGEARRLAPAYYPQTAYFWAAPPGVLLFHWLPEQVRARWLIRRQLPAAAICVAAGIIIERGNKMGAKLPIARLSSTS